MSEVYVNEPTTSGKVLLHTTFGDLEVSLWARECPKTCRSFVQLAMEGYYDNTPFHRVIKDFVVQAGDPSGTGDGGKSIYDGVMPHEFHSRLKYRYRGLVGVANREGLAESNGSQFFITLARADFLNMKSTLFGKITGNTIYNLTKMVDSVEVDAADRPTEEDMPRIKFAEVVWNPFEDIEPRCIPERLIQPTKVEVGEAATKREGLATKQKSLLSFEDVDEEASQLCAGGVVSAHDSLGDPRLEAIAAFGRSSDSAGQDNDEERKQVVERLSASCRKIVRSPAAAETAERTSAERTSAEAPRSSERSERQKEIEKLKADLRGPASAVATKEQEKGAAEQRRQVLLEKSAAERERRKRKGATSLQDLRSELRKKISKAAPLRPEILEAPTTFSGLLDSMEHDLDSEAGSDWLGGSGMQFAVDSTRAYEIDDSKSLEVIDPLLSVPAKIRAEEERKKRNQRLKPSLMDTSRAEF
eukprot:Polyplicarium_translucidae@DN3295_c0_g1_i11.p2